MRIGFDAKRIFHNDTGLGNYGRDVIRILHEHTAINKFILYNTKPNNKQRLESLTRTVIKYPRGFLWKRFSSIWRLGPITNQIGYDFIDIYHGLSGETPIGLKKNGVASVVTIHDLIFLSHPQYYSLFDRLIYKRKFRHAANNADKIIAISEQTKRDIIKYLDIDEDRIAVVYQGCNDAYKQKYSKTDKNLVIIKYGLPKEFVLNVGTLQERKNALTIVKSIKGTDISVVLIGSEKNYAKKIHGYVKENNLKNQVIFLKNVPVKELAIIYQLATLFCYPSICEGFGIPIIEALYSKTPVITTKGNCFPEAGGPSSIYLDPHDENSLKNEIIFLLSNPKKKEKMAELGHTYVQKFNDPVVAKNILGVYENVLQNLSKPEVSRQKISALMITWNEIEHIEEVLQNLSFADEIIIIDSFSTDGTIEAIKKHEKVKLIQRPFKNFTDQKSFALEQASNDWVLFMDADERLTNSLKEELLHAVDNTKVDVSAYYFYRTFMFKDEILRFSGWQTDKNYRLFRKSKVHFTSDRIVHETLIVKGKSDALQNKLIHYSFKNFEDYKKKMIKYGQMKAKEEAMKDYSPNFYHFLLRPTYKFFHHYVIRLGFLDGKKGLIISYLNALGVHARYQELKRLKSIK